MICPLSFFRYHQAAADAGKLRFLPRTEGLSTTHFIKKIVKGYHHEVVAGIVESDMGGVNEEIEEKVRTPRGGGKRAYDIQYVVKKGEGSVFTLTSNCPLPPPPAPLRAD